MQFLLTGTPGVGKTFLAKKLACALQLHYVDVNRVILERKWFRAVAGEKEVDLRKLRAFLLRLLKKEGVLFSAGCLMDPARIFTFFGGKIRCRCPKSGRR